MSKFFRIITGILVIAICAISVPIYAEEEVQASDLKISPRGTPDSEAPKLQSITIDKTTAKTGDTITVTVNVSDNVSGTCYAFVDFADETGKKCDASGELYYNAEDLTPDEISDMNNGIIKATIEITDKSPRGNFKLVGCGLQDLANNSVYYESTPDNDSVAFPDTIKPANIGFTVSGDAPAEDTITLDSVYIGLKSDTTPTETNITGVKPADTIVAVANVNASCAIQAVGLNFKGDKSKRCYETRLELKSKESNVLIGDIPIDPYEVSDTFKLESAVVRFDGGGTDVAQLSNIPTFTVVGKDSIMPLTLSEFELNDTRTIAPGIIRFHATTSANISRMCAVFTAPDGTKLLGHLNVEKGSGQAYVSEFAASGTYNLSAIHLYDAANGQMSYYVNEEDVSGNDDELWPSASFVVENDGVGSITGTMGSDLVTKITEASPGAKIFASYALTLEAPTAVFDALKGKDVTLILEGYGTRWEFNGKDILNPCDVKLKVATYEIADREIPNANAKKIAALDGNIPAVILSFDNDKDLPGKANIKLRTDYDSEWFFMCFNKGNFTDLMGTSNLYIYRYNSSANELEPIASNISVDDNGHLSFDTIHTGDFVITKGPVTSTPPEISGDGSSGNGSGTNLGSDSNSGSASTGTIGNKLGDSTGASHDTKVDTATATKSASNAVKNAINNALKANSDTANAVAHIKNGTAITAQTMSALQKAISEATNKQAIDITTTVSIDRVKNGVLEYSVAFDPMKNTLKQDMDFSLYANASYSKQKFNQYFTNPVETLSFNHIDTFGMPVDVAVKIDLSKLDITNLYLYSFDVGNNSYELMPNANPVFDKNGYLHFVTDKGYDVIITSEKLERK